MKSVFLIALFSGLSAFAETRMSHDYMQVLGQIEVKNACITDTTVRSIKSVKTCATSLRSRAIGTDVDSGQVRKEWYCPRLASRQLEYSRTFYRPTCRKFEVIRAADGDRYDCDASRQASDFLPEVIEVRVWEEGGENSTWPGKVEWHRFPRCN